ncbi:MAG: hypothetical protein IT184_12305 [Acidobacteria bacterium]|nr:hypothetical protein [Acidobacteriota bacterium]
MNRRQAITTVGAVAAGVLGARPPARAEARVQGGVSGQTLHLNPSTGSDTNTGAVERPLRSLAEAARRVNESTGAGPMTIVLAEGVYSVAEPTLLEPSRRTFSRRDRLTIRAEVLPDDPSWHMGRMPTLIHTMPVPSTWNGRPDPLGGAANGLLVETSHVTVQGLKILGQPVMETPQPGMKKRLYAIARFNRSLEDLEIAQCLFASDELIASLHVGVIAHGDSVVVRNCVFRGYTKDAVVYWTPGSTGHAMRHCVFDGMYSSTVWTAGIAGDFDYRKNVVTGANYVWIYQSGASAQADAAGGRAQLGGGTQERTPYGVIDSYFGGNKKLAGTGTGARVEFADIDPSFLQMSGTRIVDQPVELERDSTKRNYLHPAAGSPAATIGAGLFTTSTP